MLFDKINNEHLSTSDFLDSSIKHLSSQTNKSGKTKNTKQQNLNASFDQESKSSGSFYSWTIESITYKAIGLSKYKMKSHSQEKSKGRNSKGQNKKSYKGAIKASLTKKIPDYLIDTLSNSFDLGNYRK